MACTGGTTPVGGAIAGASGRVNGRVFTDLGASKKCKDLQGNITKDKEHSRKEKWADEVDQVFPMQHSFQKFPFVKAPLVRDMAPRSLDKAQRVFESGNRVDNSWNKPSLLSTDPGGSKSKTDIVKWGRNWESWDDRNRTYQGCPRYHNRTLRAQVFNQNFV